MTKFRVHWTVPIAMEVEAETPESARRIAAQVPWVPNGEHVKFWPSAPVVNWSMGFPVEEARIEEVEPTPIRAME